MRLKKITEKQKKPTQVLAPVSILYRRKLLITMPRSSLEPRVVGCTLACLANRPMTYSKKDNMNENFHIKLTNTKKMLVKMTWTIGTLK
jgi:hypothetical protein